MGRNRNRRGRGGDAGSPNAEDETDTPMTQQQQSPENRAEEVAAANQSGEPQRPADDPAAAVPELSPSQSPPGQKPLLREQATPAPEATGGGKTIPNYGAAVTPIRGEAPFAPPPTPATAYKRGSGSERNVKVMVHDTGAMVQESDSLLTKADGSAAARPRRHSCSSTGSNAGRSLTLKKQLSQLVFDKWQLKLLLAAVPIAIVGPYVPLGSGVLFFAAFLGLIPLAGLLGDFTEDLALRSNDVVGALINVTFGNATELIISIMALRAGMLDVIKLSLIGSVLGNMLLVLGTALLVGGLKYKDMVFNSDAVNCYGPLLLLSMLSIVIPSAYFATALPASQQTAEHRHSGGGWSSRPTHEEAVVLSVSRHVAVVMCLVYVAYLYFQLVTHKHLFDAPGASVPPGKQASVLLESRSMRSALFVPSSSGGNLEDDEDEEEEEEEDAPQFTLVFGLVGLAIVSVLISMLSDTLVDTLTDAADSWHLPKQFIGIILVPIVGNAAEHSSAILMAARNKPDIAVGVALGSSIQIAMFVLPVLVIAGWIMGAPLTLDFHPFLTITTVLSVLVVQAITTDGKTNWLEGAQLLAAYLMIALMFLNGTVELS